MRSCLDSISESRMSALILSDLGHVGVEMNLMFSAPAARSNRARERPIDKLPPEALNASHQTLNKRFHDG